MFVGGVFIMDRIELAERAYRQIMPQPISSWHEMPVRKLVVWLQDVVAPLVGEYVTRPKFRNVADWPIRNFRTGADSDARRQVNAAAEALSRHARLLGKALRLPRVTTVLTESLQPIPLVDEEVSITGAGSQRISSRRNGVIDPLPLMARQVEAIARPFWSDLVNPTDYLGPHGGWLLREPSVESSTDGVFVVSLNPELHALGDFVTRCLHRRIDVLVAILNTANQAILRYCPVRAGVVPQWRTNLVAGAELLQEAIRQLHTVCGPDAEASVRDSCVTLTQAYLAFHPAPEVEWLGLPNEVVETGLLVLRHRLTHLRNPEFPERVAAALGDLRRLYANEPPGRPALEEAIGGGGLVLTTTPPQAYWEGKPIDVDWGAHTRPWEMLHALARKARLEAAVEERDLFSGGVSESAMGTLWGRLKKLLPVTLKKQILKGIEHRSYKLNLGPARIMIFTPPA